uniref:Uncharacterized protein n=1 Tax=Mycena chlorophos TaxID=658473 RepID=A0ABQ0L7J6_MYCCL|nr:predicted protein [Mycena chlorophos]
MSAYDNEPPRAVATKSSLPIFACAFAVLPLLLTNSGPKNVSLSQLLVLTIRLAFTWTTQTNLEAASSQIGPVLFIRAHILLDVVAGLLALQNTNTSVSEPGRIVTVLAASAASGALSAQMAFAACDPTIWASTTVRAPTEKLPLGSVLGHTNSYSLVNIVLSGLYLAIPTLFVLLPFILVPVEVYTSSGSPWPWICLALRGGMLVLKPFMTHPSHDTARWTAGVLEIATSCWAANMCVDAHLRIHPEIGQFQVTDYRFGAWGGSVLGSILCEMMLASMWPVRYGGRSLATRASSADTYTVTNPLAKHTTCR